jgi:putative transposase
MKKARFSEEQIVQILHENERGTEARELCRRHGITETTFYRWRKKYGGLQVSEARRLKALEEENRRLKRLVADQALNVQVLQDLLGKGS